eukprot:scaffold79603_cov14-Tisochrysis_lutea.AAC.1
MGSAWCSHPQAAWARWPTSTQECTSPAGAPPPPPLPPLPLVASAQAAATALVATLPFPWSHFLPGPQEFHL